jgi:Na+/H+ antiporter NhaD/arsenite permease-like protein
MWTMWNLWPAWLVANSILVFLYYALDRIFFYPREASRDIRKDERVVSPLKVEGLWPNALLLAGIILSVALLDPSKTLQGTDWHPWLYLREIVQLALVGLSLYLGSREVRRANRFTYHAIVEVAALFIGIFICMQPAIEILNVKGPNLGINTSAKFFWATGGLSSVLDNAPTYIVFFKTADALFPGQGMAELVSANPPDPAANLYLIGISLGAVFLGAMTYIGNGPNFMVRAIAEESGVRMPSFFGYALRYSIPILIPVFLLTALIFLRSA